MLATLRHRDFALLWTAGLVSQLGDWALIAALPVWVYVRTGSALASGLIWLMWLLPGILFGSVAGVFVDRWDRRRTMVVASLTQAVILLALVPVTLAGWVWVVFPVAFAEGTIVQFFAPAENALLPRLVGEDRLLTANALNSLNDNAGRIGGSALGGLLLATGGLGAVALLDAVSFLAAALLIARLSVRRERLPDAPVAGNRTGAWAAVGREWADGLGVIRRSPQLRRIFLVAAAGLLADGVLTGLLVPFVAGLAGDGEATLGLFLAVRGIAGLIGGVVIGWLGPRVREGELVGWSLVAVGGGFGLIVNAHSVPLVLGVLIVLGPAIAGWLTGQQTLLQRATEDQYRGRVFGAFGAAGSLVNAAGIGAASLLGATLGARPVLNGGAFLYAATGLLALIVLRAPFVATPVIHEPPRDPGWVP
jgi:predicted MFS family arabinose efflux permease